jgi:NAD-reducing hydrogenase small subunit
MSVLDIDEAIINVAKKVDVVYGPLVDAQEFPKGVDVTVIEGPSARKTTWRRCTPSAGGASSWWRWEIAR